MTQTFVDSNAFAGNFGFVPALAKPDRRLLIIDDDPLTHEVLSLLAAEAGFSSDSYESGDAALVALRAPVRFPHIIIADMQMPGPSGNQLALQLRHACGPSTVLLAMSGSEVNPQQVAHFDAFLLKPFCFPDIERLLLQLANPATTSPVVTPPSDKKAAPMLNQSTYSALADSMSPVQLKKLYAICLDDADARIQALRQASEAKDAEAWKRNAHSIRGSCGMVGALELASVAAEMEASGLPDSDHPAPYEDFLAASARLRRMLDSQ